jgi:aryl-alcohol dehydrogenase-like predicted oxidoreductase
MVHVALAWLFHKPAVTSVLAGVQSAAGRKQAHRRGMSPSAETMRRLDEATGGFKQKLGPDPDMWGAGEDSRYR